MTLKITKFLFCTIAALPFTGMAQNGPAGIGSTSGGSSLQMWYESRDMDGDNVFTDNPANSTTLSSWTDKSGNGRNLVAPGGFGPSYNTGLAFNTVDFSSNGTIHLMNVSSPPGALCPGTMYFFYHIVDVSGDGAFCLFDDPSTSVRVAQWNNTDELGFTRYSIADYSSGTATNYNAFNISSWRRPGGASNNVIVTQNATSVNVNIANATDGLPTMAIGKNTSNDGANANLGEILVYNTALNLAQQNIVENYLSAKYSGTGTAVSIPDDIYLMDNNANGNYDSDVAGIGQASDGSSHTTSMGTGIVQFSNPSGLGNNEYMFWGHNNGVMQSMNFADIPSGVQARWGRVWRISERGNVGNVDITFNLTGFGPITASDLRLIIDANNNNSLADETAISGATALGGNMYRFSAVAGVANNLRFSLGTINNNQTPLPVDLLYFSAKLDNSRKGLLEWSTASEMNCSYFAVERSADGLRWELLAQLDAAGSAYKAHNYETRDMAPFAGTTYYRLKEVSLMGNYQYFPVRSIDIRTASHEGVIVYPNPSDGYFTLEAVDEELASVHVYDLVGREVEVPVSNTGNGRMILNLSALSSGKYLLKTSTTMQLIEKN